MRNLLLPILILSTIGNAQPCSLSNEDQISLIALSRTKPTALLSDLAGKSVQCASIGSLRLVRTQGAGFLYILDVSRVFLRWTVTQSQTRFNLKLLVQSYLDTSKDSPTERFARLGQIDELDYELTLKSISGLSWNTIQMVDQETFMRAKSEPLSGSTLPLIKSLLRDRVRIALLNEGYPIEHPMIEHKTVGSYDVDVEVRCLFAWKGATTELHFLVPLNTRLCPFVGRPARIMAGR